MKDSRMVACLALTVLYNFVSVPQAGTMSLLTAREGADETATRQGLMTSCATDGSWMAYFKSGKGEVSPVRNTLNIERDDDWLGLRFSDYDGPRIRLGILKVVNKTAEAEEQGSAGGIEVPVSGIQEMLAAALFNTKRFDVVEQRRIDDVLRQQMRIDTTNPGLDSIVQVGKVLGAQYLGYATVNEWSATNHDSKTPRNPGPGKISVSEVAITFFLTEISSGRNVFITTESARISNGRFTRPGTSAPESEEPVPVNYAVRACANKAALKIAAFLSNSKWNGTVVDIKGANVYINAGRQNGIAELARLAVLAIKGIVRNERGLDLGEDTLGIGILQVVVVKDAFSIARIMDGCKGLKVGDRVELASPTSPPKVRPECASLVPDLSL